MLVPFRKYAVGYDWMIPGGFAAMVEPYLPTVKEVFFSWPGMGSYMMTAITRRDYPTLMGIYFVISVSVAVMMVTVDVLYTYLDPRIGHSSGK